MRRDDTPRGADILALIAPTLVWAVHFVAIYALVSAACSPRALIGAPGLLVMGGLVTLVALGGSLAPVLRVLPGRNLRTALAVVSGISAATILLQASILILFPGCGG